MENKNIYQTKFDSKLREINMLKWLPWVGENFESSSLKLLVVGESHYESGENEKKYEMKSVPEEELPLTKEQKENLSLFTDKERSIERDYLMNNSL